MTKRARKPKEPKPISTIIGIDGEGFTGADGVHRYTYMAAHSEDELVSEISDCRGLTSDQIFDWLIALPEALIVAFSFGYDLTKWLENWPNAKIFLLTHTDLRHTPRGPRPVKYKGYKVNLLSTRFSLQLGKLASVTVWDLWKFFQSSFVVALTRWNIGTPEQRERIASNKLRRAEFVGIDTEEREYCQLECKLLAQLARALITTHETLDIPLTNYYGPGATATAVLSTLGEQRAQTPSEMFLPIHQAYFGGRFEHSRVGPIRQKLYSYDITSAYPHAMAQVPCLLHGHWQHQPKCEHVPEGIASLVHYHVEPCPERAWGPLPYRLADGNIIYPLSGPGGWQWAEEVRAALELAPDCVKIKGAWVWKQGCDCAPPFKLKIEELFAARLRAGKDAQGIVLKLALNSLYGKSAQRVGSAKFRCMVRAGLITSITRAKLLRAVIQNPSAVIELATDSVLSTDPLNLEAPGLGGWTSKSFPDGVFILKPGMRFSLETALEPWPAPNIKLTEAQKEILKQTAARGVGVRLLHENRMRAVAEWGKNPLQDLEITIPSFFHGAKSSVTKSKRGYNRSPLYGQWDSPPRVVHYSAEPKRKEFQARADGSYDVLPWTLNITGVESAPYGIATSPEEAELQAARDIADEQEDGGGVQAI